jgi:hypothetical protein
VTEPSPYSTPKAHVDDLPEPVDRRFRWKAVLLGAATDLGGSMAAGIVLFFVFSAWLTGEGTTTEELVAQLAGHWPFVMVSMVVGGACTVLGGYVAGRVARHSCMQHALAAGALSLVLGIMLFHHDEGPYAGIIALVGYGLHLPLATFGGWLAVRQRLVS